MSLKLVWTKTQTEPFFSLPSLWCRQKLKTFSGSVLDELLDRLCIQLYIHFSKNAMILKTVHPLWSIDSMMSEYQCKSIFVKTKCHQLPTQHRKQLCLQFYTLSSFRPQFYNILWNSRSQLFKFLLSVHLIKLKHYPDLSLASVLHHNSPFLN